MTRKRLRDLTRRQKIYLQVVITVIVAFLSAYIFFLFVNLTAYEGYIHYPYPIYVSNWIFGMSAAFLIFKKNETLNMIVLSELATIGLFFLKNLISYLILDFYHLLCIAIGGWILYEGYKINLKKLAVSESIIFTWILTLIYFGEYSPAFVLNDRFLIILNISILTTTHVITFLIAFVIQRYREHRKNKKVA